MGEVYLAQDTRLDRRVALKTLPADLAANEDRMRRFVQEAKAAVTLNHPSIAHTYEIGEKRRHLNGLVNVLLRAVRKMEKARTKHVEGPT